MYARTLIAVLMAFVASIVVLACITKRGFDALPVIAAALLLPIGLAEADRQSYGKNGFPRFVLGWLAVLVLLCMGMFFVGLRHGR